ncbi:putative nuclease HARBI1 [Pecten maximus]|uniref:putative nuclease HARBI1 n=1 Tax=Pecten maximus TaxID=6579 RepID=UPI001458E8A4|nr:putative nuclease HARBI1 [Pecten maximus]
MCRVFVMLTVCQHMEAHQNLENVLLGDSGYPCQPFLLTPYLNPNCPAQRHYNYAHGRTRSVIASTSFTLRYACSQNESSPLSWHVQCFTTLPCP